MLSFEPTEEQELIRETVQSFATAELVEAARAAEENSEVPAGLLQAAWELGLVAGQIPEAYGGAGMDRSPVTNCLVLEELGAGCPALASAIMATSAFVNPLIDFGTDAQKKEFLPLFTGQSFTPAAIAIHEPQLAFDVNRMRSVAERSGDDWLLTGIKRFVPLGVAASHFLILARNGDETGVNSIEAFIVPADTAGLQVTPEDEARLGLNAMPVAVLEFDGMKVPAGARLGGDAGVDGARLMNSVRVSGLALAVGLARAVTAYCIPYVQERQAFGTAIGRKQAIAFMMADMHADVETMRWLVWKAASALEHAKDSQKETAIAQNYVGRKAMRIADDGLQIFGGHGFIRELPLEMWYRNMRTLTVLEGTAAA